MRDIYKVSLWAGTCIALFGHASPSLAQATQNAKPQDTSATARTQDIVVTARRRAEDIERVPVAITAFTGQDLANKNVQTVADLQNFVPSLNVTSSVTRNDFELAIRGMGQTAGLTAGEGGGTGVAAYFADAVTSAAGPGLFYDLANVQVLKGPQGTLFGKNTTGGAVLFTPRKPDNNFGGYLETDIGNYDLRSVTGAVNVPIIRDKLLLRVAGESYSRDGFTIDRGPYFRGKDYDNVDYSTGRISLVFRPVDNLENDTIVTGIRSNEHGDGYVLAAVNPAVASPDLIAYFQQQRAAGIKSTAFSTNEIDKRLNYGIFNTTTWHASSALTLKNIFSYQVQKLRNANDIDASPFVMDDLVGAPGAPWHLQTGTYTEEFQAQGDAANSNLHWTAGGYYEFAHNLAPEPFQVNAGGGFIVAQPDASHSERTRGLYAQASYDLGGLTDALNGLKFTAGYRHSWDSYHYGIAVYAPTLGNACLTGSGTYPTSNCFFGIGGRSNAGSWTLGLDYQVSPQTLLYVRSGKGYLPGGVNPAVALVPGGTSSPNVTFAPATNIDVELGVKSKFHLGTMPVTVNADAFRTNFNNIQRLVSSTIFGISTSFTTNASEAVIEGLELEAHAAPVKGVLLNLTYSYNHGRYTKIDPAVAPSLLGLPFANLPAHQLSVGASYDSSLPREMGHVTLSATYSYQSRFFNAPAVQPLDYIGSRGLLDASATWADFFGRGFDVTFFVTNAANIKYRLGQNNNYYTDGFITSFYGEPRMFGVKLRYRFGADR